MNLSYTKIQYGVILIFLLIDVLWIYFSSLSFSYDSELSMIVIIGLFIFFVPYLFYKIFRPDPRIVSLLESLFILLTFVQVMIVFSYLVATLNYPLIDSTLAFVDSIFKVNASAMVSWFRAHSEWHNIFDYIYDCFLYQIPFIILYFSFRGDVLILQRFITQFMIALLITLILSGLLPSLGPYAWYHFTPTPANASALDQLLELREGILNISKRNGIVTFPSFHAAMALIYIYTFRHENKFLFIPILILNLLIIFSCIPIGEHYFTDLVGVIPIFIATIWIDNLIYKHLVQKI